MSENEYEKPRYLSCAETAKLVRKALRDAFPGQKFYVRSDTYSGGASIDIYWLDGPTTKEVDAVVKVFEGSDFDGMIDMKCHWNHWLLPDGSVKVAKGPGTAGSRGYIRPVNNPKPHPEAELVSFMADYVFTRREHSPEFLSKVAADYHEETGWDKPEIVESKWFVGGKPRKEAVAHFEELWVNKVPGGNETIGRMYSRRAHETSDYKKPKPKAKAKAKAAPKPKKAKAEPPANNDDEEPRVEIERDWVWAYFPSAPGENTLESLRALKKHYGGGFSGKRQGWYFKSLAAEAAVRDIASVTWRY